MNVRSPLVAYPQPPTLRQPGQGAFDDPARDPQAATMVRPTFGEHRGNPHGSQLLAMRFRIIGPISLHALGAASGTPSLAPNRRDGFEPWQPLRHIMAMRPRHQGGQRHALRIGDHMVFTATFPAISRIGARFFPLPRRPEGSDYRRPPGTNRSCPPHAAWRGGRYVTVARHRRGANRASDASRSSQSHHPSLGGAVPKEDRTSEQRGCRSTPRGRVSVADRPWPWEAQRDTTER